MKGNIEYIQMPLLWVFVHLKENKSLLLKNSSVHYIPIVCVYNNHFHSN